MSLEIKVGPPHLAIHQGHTVLVSDTDGQITWPSIKGLYFFDTRLISNWTIYADGEPWDLLSSGTTTSFTARMFLTNRGLKTEQGLIAPHTLGLALNRHIDGGMHEDLDLTNYGNTNVHFNLEIAVRCDFADIFEVKSGQQSTTQPTQAIPQELRKKLTDAGFTDVKIVPSSYFVTAKNKQGHDVLMRIGPNSMTVLTEAPADNTSTTGAGAPSASQ
jgi:glycogen debranching enzyme